MGMYATLRRADAADAERLRADPALVAPFLFGEEPPVVTERPRGLLGLLLRFTPIKVQRATDTPASPSAAPAWPPAADGEALDLDKAWHGLHFLFTGTAEGGAEPACFLLSGGEDTGEDEWGDPVARLLRPEQVRDLAAFLGALTPDELTRRFDPPRMTALKVYPAVIWQRADDAHPPLQYLLGAFEDLRVFAAAAAAAGDAVVVSVQ